MADTIAAIGTQLQLGDGGSPESFTTIAKVRDIKGPGLKTDVVDVTSHDSPGNVEEILPTLKRLDTITFKISYIPTDPTHNDTTGLVKKWEARTKANMKLKFTDPGITTWTFAGYVIGLSPDMPVAGVLTMDVTIRLAGAPTLA